MKKLLPVLFLAALGALAWLYLDRSAEPAFVLEEGYTLLYDGDSLAGWRKVGGGATFAAEGESIVGRRGPGANTFLRTEKTYGNFNLRLQARWDETGNSGVMFRAAQRGGDGRTFGYQYELDPSERAWSGGIYDEARRGWLANLEDNDPARRAVRLDGWNDVEIEARGTSLKTWINGVPAADIVDGLSPEGFIALQVHSGETGVIRWRRIRIRELPAVGEPGDSLLDTAEWRDAGEAGLAIDGNALVVPAATAGRWLESRRQFSDVMVRMSLPTCEEPTRLQMRYRIDASASGATFAELVLHPDRAEGRLMGPGGEQVMEPVKLPSRDRHRFLGITRGQSVVFTVGERDVLRLEGSGLYERGPLRILPGRCDDDAKIAGLEWFSLKETSAEPLFYETLDNSPSVPLSPEEALGAFRIAPGFEIELVAAEPLVEDPVAMAWDEHGRLYVVEMRGYMPDAYGTGSEEPVGQVVRLTDTDGDGRMDESDVFLGELVNPRAVAVVNEGVLIAEPPNLWLCELPARDALCENRRSVGGYATDDAANVEHMENGLRQGLDNWLYNSKSSRQLRLVDGELREREGLARGQWGITKDDYGRWLYNHNSTWIQADFFQAEDLVVPGEGTYPRGLGVNLVQPSPVYSVRVNPGVNRAYLDNTLREDGRLATATGVSGLVAYRGDQFPAEFAGDVFVPEPAGNVVAQFDMGEEGMALTASQRLYDDEQWGQRDFLGSTDERFRPVDAMNGPDGALYIIDMYRGIIQDDHFLTDELRAQILERGLDSPLGMGRIWRVRHTEGGEARAVKLSGATDEQLVEALSHPNGWVRDTAQRLLLRSDGHLAGALGAVARGPQTIAAIHALWTLEGREELDAPLVLEMARGGDPWRQVHALRAGSDLPGAEDYLALAGELDNAPDAVRMQLVFAMGGHAADARIRSALAGMATAPGAVKNMYLRQALVRAVRGHEAVFLAEVLPPLAAGNASRPTAALISALAAGAYRAMRGEISSTEPANPALLELLELAQARSGKDAWQQVAMLKGFERVSKAPGFVPANLEAPPAIFSDGAIAESDPLWDARLAGRRAFTWPGDEVAMGLTPLGPEQLELMERGRAFYPQCGACHGEDGAGIAGLAPALAGASWVTGPPEWLGRIVLQGMTGPVEVNGEIFDGVMPPHNHLPELDDATLAGLMTYLRRSFGNRADPVPVEVVSALRADSAGRDSPWTAAELQAVPYDRGLGRFTGKFKVSFVTFTLTEAPEGLALSVPMYGSGVLTQESETVFSGAAAGESVKVEFVIEPDGSVNTMILYRDGQKIPVERVE